MNKAGLGMALAMIPTLASAQLTSEERATTTSQPVEAVAAGAGPNFWLDEGGALDPRVEGSLEGLSASLSAGYHVTLLGDVNGDEVLDVAVTDASALVTHVQDGATGAALFSVSVDAPFASSTYEDWFRPIVLAPGDLDGDGLADVVLASGPAGTLKAFKGDGSAELWTWVGPEPPEQQYSAWSATLVEDVDGDEIPDVAVVGRRPPGFGSLVRYTRLSGASGALQVQVLRPLGWPLLFASACASVGDLTDDGYDELLVGVTNTSSSDQPSVFLLDGFDLSTVRIYPSPFTSDDTIRFGVVVASAGDVNGDGVAEHLICAPDFDRLADFAGDPVLRGAIRVHDGATGTLLNMIEGEELFDSLGARLLGAVDVDDDGVPELVTSVGIAPEIVDLAGPMTGRLSVRRVLDGEELVSFESPVAEALFGSGFDVARDAAGELRLAVGAPLGGRDGRIYLYDQLDHPGAPLLEGGGQPVPGERWLLTLKDGPAFASTGVFLGASRIDVPFKGGVLVPSPDAILFVALDGDGSWQIGGVWPASVPAGVPLWIQAWVSDAGGPAGFTASAGLLTVES